MNAREGERLRALRQFLEGAFDPEEFAIVLTENDLAEIASAVNANAAGTRYFFNVIRELEKRGLIDGAFFGLLKKVRPAKSKAIDGLAQLWLVADEIDTKPPGPMRSRSPREPVPRGPSITAGDSEDESAPKGEIHYAAYRAALERRSWGEALTALQQAVAADPHLAAWPANTYQAERILGAGAIGVAFLCYHRYKGRHVVIKTFKAADLDRDIDTLFEEARILDRLDHPGIVRLQDVGFADPERRHRPYLEFAYFPEGLALNDHLRRHGPLSLDDLRPVAVQIAEALRAAHKAGVLHRDVKPGNVLLRRAARAWEVKVVDFGLSLRPGLVRVAQAQAAGLKQSRIGRAIAETLQYAAPEQLDPDRSKEVGTHSDVFSFGRMCYFALFGDPQPDQVDLNTLPPFWKDFLGQCTAKKIERRPKDFTAVLMQLADIRKPRRRGSAPGFTNFLDMTMVRIEPGEFLMGSTRAQIDKLMKQFPDLDRQRFDDEQPQHPVKITRSLYLAAHQVTVGQFRRFVEGSGYKTEAERGDQGSYAWDGKEWTLDPEKNWTNPGFTQGDDHPVVCVSHKDAMAFVRWLAGQGTEKDRGYRLPSEAEWEYACRAGTGGLHGSDDDPESLVRIANVADASHKKVNPNATCIRGDDGYAHTAPVGSFQPNAWQLYDMIGNVWEWCDDWYDPRFYQSSPKEDPRNVTPASLRVIRGGGWSDHPRACRPADRGRFTPGGRVTILGFRVAAVQE